MYSNGRTESIPLEETADVDLGTKERRRVRISDGAHKMPVVGKIVIKASDSGVRRTRGACGRAKTDCVQAVTHRGVVAHRQVTPEGADDRIEPQTAWVTGGSVPWAAGGRGGQRVITHDARSIHETQGACTQRVGRNNAANSGRLRKPTPLIAPKNKCALLPNWPSHCNSKTIVLKLGIRNAHAITVPCICIEVVILEVLVKSAVKSISAPFGDEGKLSTLPTTVTGVGIGRCDAEFLDTVRGKRDGTVDDVGWVGLHAGTDYVVSSVNAINGQSRLVAARPCHRSL